MEMFSIAIRIVRFNGHAESHHAKLRFGAAVTTSALQIYSRSPVRYVKPLPHEATLMKQFKSHHGPFQCRAVKSQSTTKKAITALLVGLS